MTTMASTISLNSSNTTEASSAAIYSGETEQTIRQVTMFYAVSVFILSPIIVIANIVLVVSILSNPKLRANVRYLAIVSIAVADFLIGLIVCPIKGEVTLLHKSNHGCATLYFVSVFESYVQIFIATWTLVIINTDVILSLLKIKIPELTPLKRKMTTVSLALLPWMADLFGVLPGFSKYISKFRDFGCYAHSVGDTAPLIASIQFAAPAICIMSQVFFITYVKLRRRRQNQGRLFLEDTYFPYVTVSIISLLLIAVEQSAGFFQKRFYHSMSLSQIYIFYCMVILMSDMKSAVVPLLWLLLPELRESLKDVPRKLRSLVRKETTTDMPANSYVHFSNNPTDNA